MQSKLGIQCLLIGFDFINKRLELFTVSVFDVGPLHVRKGGSQYCSHEYRNILEQYGFQGSMSKRGDCYDNAPIESFWGILKNELVHHYNYQTREEAKADIIKYIELFYNHRRIQKGLGFKTPNQMAEDFYKLAA